MSGHRVSKGLGLLVLVALASPARAQDDCEEPVRAPIEVTPASAATNVTIDAPVMVRYGAGYFGPDGPGEPPSSLFALVSCGRCGTPCSIDEGTPVPGLVQTQGDVLAFLPDGGLLANTQYRGRATGVDNFLLFDFCTGAAIDLSPPTPGALANPTATAVGSLSCLPDGGYRVGVYFSQAQDDGPGGSIEYFLFQTRGVGIDAPVLVDRVRNFAGDQITMSFLLTPAQARLPVCFQVVVVDGLGNATTPAGDRCVDPLARVTFQGACTAGRSSRASPLCLVLAAASALVARRRSNRSRARCA